jgi:hypothetical protein
MSIERESACDGNRDDGYPVSRSFTIRNQWNQLVRMLDEPDGCMCRLNPTTASHS